MSKINYSLLAGGETPPIAKNFEITPFGSMLTTLRGIEKHGFGIDATDDKPLMKTSPRANMLSNMDGSKQKTPVPLTPVPFTQSIPLHNVSLSAASLKKLYSSIGAGGSDQTKAREESDPEVMRWLKDMREKKKNVTESPLPAHLEQFKQAYSKERPTAHLPIMQQLSPRTAKKVSLLPKPLQSDLEKAAKYVTLSKNTDGEKIYESLKDISDNEHAAKHLRGEIESTDINSLIKGITILPPRSIGDDDISLDNSSTGYYTTMVERRKKDEDRQKRLQAIDQVRLAAIERNLLGDELFVEDGANGSAASMSLLGARASPHYLASFSPQGLTPASPVVSLTKLRDDSAKKKRTTATIAVGPAVGAGPILEPLRTPPSKSSGRTAPKTLPPGPPNTFPTVLSPIAFPSTMLTSTSEVKAKVVGSNRANAQKAVLTIDTNFEHRAIPQMHVCIDSPVQPLPFPSTSPRRTEKFTASTITTTTITTTTTTTTTAAAAATNASNQDDSSNSTLVSISIPSENFIKVSKINGNIAKLKVSEKEYSYYKIPMPLSDKDVDLMKAEDKLVESEQVLASIETAAERTRTDTQAITDAASASIESGYRVMQAQFVETLQEARKSRKEHSHFMNSWRAALLDDMGLNVDPLFNEMRFKSKAAFLLFHFVYALQTKSAIGVWKLYSKRWLDAKIKRSGFILTRVARGMLGRMRFREMKRLHELRLKELERQRQAWLLKRNISATKIICLFRGNLARKQVARLRRRYEAAAAIQALVRGVLTRVRIIRAALLRKGVLRIQCFFRKTIARRKVNLYRKIEKVAIYRLIVTRFLTPIYHYTHHCGL